MKKVVICAFLLFVFSLQAQTKPKYESVGDLVEVTYFYKDGTVREKGFFKNKKLEGTWLSFDERGNKTAIAHYKNGKKTGKWFLWHKEGLREVNYKNSMVASVQNWREETKIAIK